MTILELVLYALPLLGISNVVTFFLTKKKYTAEVDSQQIRNVEDSFELYKKIMNDALRIQDEKIALLQKENESQRQQIESQSQQINQLQMQLIGLVGNLHAPKSKTRK